MLRKKNITLNGKKASGTEKILEGDIITFFLSDETYAKFSGGNKGQLKEDLEFQKLKELKTTKQYERFSIIYENEDILAINKPVGMLSQKAKANDISANELLISYLINSDKLSKETFRTFRPSVANRLDRNTSGLLLAGKTMRGLQELANALRERTMEKYYVCLVDGVVKKPIMVEGYLIKDDSTNTVTISNKNVSNAKFIKTAYEPLSCNGNYTRLRVHLITGRTHQIRAHLAHIGHPILGDYKYGSPKTNEIIQKKYGINYQLLHAYEILFEDGLHIFAPIPQIFDTIEKGV